MKKTIKFYTEAEDKIIIESVKAAKTPTQGSVVAAKKLGRNAGAVYVRYLKLNNRIGSQKASKAVNFMAKDAFDITKASIRKAASREQKLSLVKELLEDLS